MNDSNLKNISPERIEHYLFKHAPGKISTEIDGESVIMDVQSGTYSSLNPVGSLIWKELREENRFASILESIVDHFEVPLDVAKKELAEFLDLLIEKNLVTATEAADRP